MSRLEKKLIIEISQNEDGFFIIYHKKLIDELNGKVLLEGNIIEDFLYEENIDSKIDGYLSALNDLGYDVTTREVTNLNDKKEEGKKPLGRIKELKIENLELKIENLELKIENSKLKDSNSELTTLIDQLEDEYASLRDMYFWVWWLLLMAVFANFVVIGCGYFVKQERLFYNENK